MAIFNPYISGISVLMNNNYPVGSLNMPIPTHWWSFKESDSLREGTGFTDLIYVYDTVGNLDLSDNQGYYSFTTNKDGVVNSALCGITNQYLDSGTITIPSGSLYTITLWSKMGQGDTQDARVYLAYLTGLTASPEINWMWDPTSPGSGHPTTDYQWVDSGGTALNFRKTGFTAGEWYFHAITCSGSTHKIYTGNTTTDPVLCDTQIFTERTEISKVRVGGKPIIISNLLIYLGTCLDINDLKLVANST